MTFLKNVALGQLEMCVGGTSLDPLSHKCHENRFRVDH